MENKINEFKNNKKSMPTAQEALENFKKKYPKAWENTLKYKEQQEKDGVWDKIFDDQIKRFENKKSK